MTFPPDSLPMRLTLSYSGIFLACFAAALLCFYGLVNAILHERLDEDLAEDLLEFQQLWQTEGLERLQTEIRRETATSDAEHVFIRLLDITGREQFASSLTHWQPADYAVEPELWARIRTEPKSVFYSKPRVGEDFHTRMVMGSLAPGLILQIGESSEEKDEFMQAMLQVAALTFCVMIAFATLVGWWMAKQALLGVEAVSRAAMDVANGALERSVSVTGQGIEIDRLATTFNIMVERIRARISGMREMTDNIAHDMRSPLARIHANAELALSGTEALAQYRHSAEDTVDACDRLLQMINTTLDVAEAEAGAASFQMNEVDLAVLVSEACELFEPVAEDKDIALHVRTEPGCRVYGDTPYLQRTLANLLDNALKYTPSPGQVEVAVSSDNGQASVQVRDTGIGIAATDQAHIFDRYFRCDPSRTSSGFGLGLSFARAVARAHGGDIQVASHPGDGSLFTVTLPLEC